MIFSVLGPWMAEISTPGIARAARHSIRGGSRVASYSRDQAVIRIAAGQRNLVTTRQLAECGLQKDAIAHRVKGGWLHLVFNGVYSVGGAELPPFALELAALLACGNGTFLSHRSAAFVWGLRKTSPRQVEVSVLETRGAGPGCEQRERGYEYCPCSDQAEEPLSHDSLPHPSGHSRGRERWAVLGTARARGRGEAS